MENQIKVLSIYIHLGHSSWTVLTYIIFYSFIFFYFGSFCSHYFTINLSLSPILCIFFPYKKMLSLSLKFFFIFCWIFFSLYLYLRLMNICFLEFNFLKFSIKKYSLPTVGSPTRASFPYCPIIN